MFEQRKSIVWFLFFSKRRILWLTGWLLPSMASSSSSATPSNGVPNVLPSQVLSVSPSLPTNKLLDNLTVNPTFDKEKFFVSPTRKPFLHLEKSKTSPIITTKLWKTSFFHGIIQNITRWLLLFTWTCGCSTLCRHMSSRYYSNKCTEFTRGFTRENACKFHRHLFIEKLDFSRLEYVSLSRSTINWIKENRWSFIHPSILSSRSKQLSLVFIFSIGYVCHRI